MAAPNLKQLQNKMTLLFRVHNQTTKTISCIFCRNYQKKSDGKQLPFKSPGGSRNNVKYQYKRGDPVQEDHDLESNRAGGFKNKKFDQTKKPPQMFTTESGLIYEKLVDQDLRLGQTLIKAKAGKTHKNEDTILLEGQRLISDALLLGARAKALYFSDPEVLQNLPISCLENVNLFKIFYRDMKTWSDTVTPSGLLGLFSKPHQGEVSTERPDNLPITLVLDGVKDPGNAGTIIRTAAAMGCCRVIAMRGSVNIWEGKVLRSAMGGHFSIPLYWDIPWADMSDMVTKTDRETRVLLADSKGGKKLARAFDAELDPDTLPTEELNEEEPSSDSDSDEDLSEEAIAKAQDARTDKLDKKREERSYPYHKVPMGVFNYSDVSLPPWSSSADSLHVVLVLGGETTGISAQAKKFAFNHYGEYVTIPMAPTVDSLNTGIAGSVILYELRKKMIEQLKAGKLVEEAVRSQ